MPANPDKTRCSVPGCRAWAMRDSDPPICSVHAGRPYDPGPGKSVGAPPGNDNALFHGLYSAFLRDADGNPVEGADATTLDGEIAITRIGLLRVLTMLLTGSTGGTRPRRLDTADIARLVGLAFQGARTVARLLEIRHDLGGDGDDGFLATINETLDELSEKWGFQL